MITVSIVSKPVRSKYKSSITVEQFDELDDHVRQWMIETIYNYISQPYWNVSTGNANWNTIKAARSDERFTMSVTDIIGNRLIIDVMDI